MKIVKYNLYDFLFFLKVLLGNKDQLSMKWPHVDIREIHQRRYQLLDVGLEIFLTNGKTCLLAFPSSQVSIIYLYKKYQKYQKTPYVYVCMYIYIYVHVCVCVCVKYL